MTAKRVLKNTTFIFCAVSIVALFYSQAALGQGIPRSEKIDFEDEVVEGVNKRPLDSLSQIAEGKGKRRKSHLYQKRLDFQAETDEVLSEIRYVQ